MRDVNSFILWNYGMYTYNYVSSFFFTNRGFFFPLFTTGKNQLVGFYDIRFIAIVKRIRATTGEC